MITACPITLMEAQHVLVKARDLIGKQRIHKLTSPKLMLPLGCTEEEGESPQDQRTGVLAWEGMLSRQILGKEVGTRVAQHRMSDWKASHIHHCSIHHTHVEKILMTDCMSHQESPRAH